MTNIPRNEFRSPQLYPDLIAKHGFVAIPHGNDVEPGVDERVCLEIVPPALEPGNGGTTKVGDHLIDHCYETSLVIIAMVGGIVCRVNIVAISYRQHVDVRVYKTAVVNWRERVYRIET